MKIKTLIIVLTLFNLTTKAQVYFGINAGGNIGGVVTKIDGKKDKGIKNATGYIVSGDINIPLGKKMLLQSGLQYESLCNKVNTVQTWIGGSGETVKETFSGKSNIDYINIPIKLAYKFTTGKNKILIGWGPNLGIGVSGKSQSTDITERTLNGATTTNVYNYKAKVAFGSTDTAVKRINCGLGFNLSYQLANNICFSAYSNIGLTNINNQNRYNTTTRAYGITIGYVFGRQEKK